MDEPQRWSLRRGPTKIHRIALVTSNFYMAKSLYEVQNLSLLENFKTKQNNVSATNFDRPSMVNNLCFKNISICALFCKPKKIA